MSNNEYKGPPVSWPGYRVPWTGENFTPPLPGRPVNRALTYEDATVPTQPNAPVSMPVVDYFRFLSINDISVFAPFVAPGIGVGSALVLNQPQSKRNFLGFRNPNALGILYVSFGQPASQNSLLAIVPGQSIFFDTSVPQDDVWISFDQAGGAQITIGWSNYKAEN